MGVPESTPLWNKIREENSPWLARNPVDVSHRPEVTQRVLIREYLDTQVSPDDTVNVEAIMDDILSHPHRQHFGTLAVPTEQDKADYEGIFSMGIPRNVMYSFSHWFRMSQPLESAREKFMKCKLENLSKEKCVDEAIAMYKLYLVLAEIPFRKCPKQSAEYTYCAETQGRYRHDTDLPRGRIFRWFSKYCRGEQAAWEGCMTKEYHVQFPPSPIPWVPYQRSARLTNLPWDKIYA
eukprot:RCo040399